MIGYCDHLAREPTSHKNFMYIQTTIIYILEIIEMRLK